MHDIKWIREHPDAFDSAMKKHGLEAQAKEILKLDEEKRVGQTKLQELQAKKNQLAKVVGAAKEKQEDTTALLAECKQVNQEFAVLEASICGEGELEKLLAGLPNIPADDARYSLTFVSS